MSYHISKHMAGSEDHLMDVMFAMVYIVVVYYPRISQDVHIEDVNTKIPNVVLRM